MSEGVRDKRREMRWANKSEEKITKQKIIKKRLKKMKMENFLALQRNDFFAIFIHFKYDYKQTHLCMCACNI